MTTALIDTIATPDGAFVVVADEQQNVLATGWTDDVERVVERIHPSLRPDDLRPADLDAAAAVRAYYRGDLSAIDSVPVRQHGTDLQLRGWAALRRIRAGEPLSYTGFATAIGVPGAVRAAASTCARNAPALFVPCHRVLRTDGTLGGFAWGVDVKASLLEREAAARNGG